MKKVVRLSESDLVNMVNRVIKEADTNTQNREMEFFSELLNPKSKEYDRDFHKKVIEPLKQDKTKYNLIFDILDYMSEYYRLMDLPTNVGITDIYKYGNYDLSKLEEYKNNWREIVKDQRDHEEREIQFKINQSKPTRRMGIHNFLVDEEWGKSTGGNYWRVIKGSDGPYIEFGKTDGHKVQVRF
jgi:hypothetical protein